MFFIREVTQDDRPLIFATWLRSFKHGSSWPRHIPDRLYFDAHHSVIDALLARSTVRVATPPDEPEVILGWSVVETSPSMSVIHYIYVKPAFRQAGIARALLSTLPESIPVYYSHESYTSRLPGIAKHMTRWAFYPYAAVRHAAAIEE
jgi:ribosomal protein S18 acetylase RimI-like enzyme